MDEAELARPAWREDTLVWLAVAALIAAGIQAAAGVVDAFHQVPAGGSLPPGFSRTRYLLMSAMDGLREPTLVCLLLATLILVYERRRATHGEVVTGVLLGLTGAFAVAAAAGAVVAVTAYLVGGGGEPSPADPGGAAHAYDVSFALGGSALAVLGVVVAVVAAWGLTRAVSAAGARDE